jgi:hypothetical protein
MVRVAGELRALTGPARLDDGAVLEIGGIELQILHPGARVDAALVRGGEATITRLSGAGGGVMMRPGPVIPIVLTVVFATLVAALLWFE